MKPTGREYGLEINDNVDERYHLEKATQVACDYLNKYKEKYGSWTLAAAAYNAGTGAIDRYMNIQQPTAITTSSWETKQVVTCSVSWRSRRS